MLQVDGAWKPEWADLYSSNACDGIQWRWHTRAKSANLSPLRELHGLQWMGLHLRGVNDALLADFTEVRELDLYSDCNEPLDLAGLHRLTVAAIERPVPIVLDGLAALTSVWVSGWRVGSFRAPDAPNLESLRIEGAVGGPGVTELANFAGIPALESLWLDRVLPTSLDAVTTLARLKHLSIAGHTREADDLFLDLTPLVACQALQHLRITGCRVRSFEPLRQLSRLITLFGPLPDQDATYEDIKATVDARYRAHSAALVEIQTELVEILSGSEDQSGP